MEVLSGSVRPSLADHEFREGLERLYVALRSSTLCCSCFLQGSAAVWMARSQVGEIFLRLGRLSLCLLVCGSCLLNLMQQGLLNGVAVLSDAGRAPHILKL